MKVKKKALAGAAVAVLAFGAGGVGVVQATNGETEGPLDLPLGFTVQPLAGERTIDVDEVPPEVLHTADQAAGTTDLRRYQIDFDDIEAVYEITGRTRGGESIEFDVRANGQLEEIEEVIDAKDVPEEVTEILEQTFPGFEITNRERSTRPTSIGLLRVFYEFDGTNGDDELDLEINQRGTVITVEPASQQQEAPGSEVPADGGGDGGDSPGSGGGPGSGSGTGSGA